MQNWLSSAVILIALFGGFIALVFWAWGKSQKPAFEAASYLPLENELLVNETLVDERLENTSADNESSTLKDERISVDLASVKASEKNL